MAALAMGLLGAVSLASADETPGTAPARSQQKLRVLFLGGSSGPHKPREMAGLLNPVLMNAGIAVEYTERTEDLNESNLAKFDCIAIYKDNGELPAENEAALVRFVEEGKGLVAIHGSTHCFRNSAAYGKLVGGRFQKHGFETFPLRIIDANHPVTNGWKPFSPTDETYVNNELGEDLRVLVVRPEGNAVVPSSWTREQQKGRVFYTALGHDERTWTQPQFHALVERGIRWAAGELKDRRQTHPPERLPARLPNYIPNAKWGTEGKAITSMQAPLAPAESMKHITTPAGFRVELFAADPDIVKPIAMAWDERGRAWIAESLDYPNDLAPAGQGRDRIKICTDTDGDGRADRFTIFADKLSIPTGLAFAAGGVVVSQAPHLLFLQDTDGDDKADVRRILFTGFGTYDTHAGPSNLRVGLDNWLWASIGYSGFEGRVGNERHSFRQGILRFRPDGSKLEFLTSSSNNTWGLGIGADGEVFYSTANREHSSYLAIPNRYFESVRGWLGRGNVPMADHKNYHPLIPTRQVDWHGEFTAAAGHALYTARQFPEAYWDRAAFVCEPTGHLVHLCMIEPRGAAFVSRDHYNIFASTDEWTAPIAADVGPDGALWVLDWYNYVIQHNPTPVGFQTGKGNAYATPLRDKKHGRIYRLVWADRPLKRPLDLAQAKPEELIAVLGHENAFWRLTAQRLLVERRQPDVVPGLVEVVRHQAKDKPFAAVHALWTLAGLSGASGLPEAAAAAARGSLTSPHPAVRKAALGVLPRNADTLGALLDSGLLRDRDALVRRAALLALAELPAAEPAGTALARFLTESANVADPWLIAAATAAAARHDRYFLAAVLAGPELDDPARSAVQIAANHYARSQPETGLVGLLQGLPGAPPRVAGALLAGMAAGWPKGAAPKLDDAAQDALAKLFDELPEYARFDLARLVFQWGSGAKFQKVMATLQQRSLAELADARKDEAVRLDAARRLAQMTLDQSSISAVLEQAGPKASPALAAGILDALGEGAAPELGAVLVERWRQLTPRIRQQAVGILLRRPGWTQTLLDGLESGQLGPADLSLDATQRLLSHPAPTIAARAKKLLGGGGGLPSADREKVVAELLPLARRNGNAAAGREIFERECAKCHRHGSLGETIGPDLTGFAVHPKEKILAEILDPNRSVEGNYRQYTVADADGRVLTGLLATETRTAIELVDSDAKRHIIQRDDIEALTASQKSLMPEGFEKLAPQELINLLEFLSSKGRFLPLPLQKSATIVSTKGMFHAEEAEVERIVLPEWGPRTVAGVPFQLVDPRGGTVPNAVLLYGPIGELCRRMPRSVSVPCNSPAKAIHLLGGISGWGFPALPQGSVSLIVRLHYAGGATEDHRLINGEHFADYIRRVDVPGSQFAFAARGQQVRYLSLRPGQAAVIEQIELLKGPDRSAPLLLAITIETPD